MTTEDKEGEI